jgi:cyclomaltodextrinase
MNSFVFLHEAAREYVCPIERNRLVLKIKCSRESGKRWELIYWNRFREDEVSRTALRFLARDDMFDCFFCDMILPEAVKYLRYCFAASDAKGISYFGPYGESDSIPGRCFEYPYTNDCDVFQIPEWAQGTVAYQIFPERFFNGDASGDPPGTESWDGKPTRTNFFGGDLRGIIKKLDHLSSLNIGLLYLTPVFRSPSNHKYDTTDYYATDPAFGTMEDLKELTKECHARNIRVILDGVFNHCGFEFAPFQDVLENGERSKYKDWFYIDGFPVRTDAPNYECVGYYKWMPKIRMRSREARKYFLDVGAYWIKEADIDGWRLDVADETDFTFWQEFRRAVKSIKKDAILIGETWKDGRDLLRGDQMDSVMNYLFRDAVAGFFAKNDISAAELDLRIQKMLSAYPQAVYPALYNLIGSHDTVRFLTLCGGDTKRMKLAAAFQMAFPGMPAVYYGDEVGMDGENDPDCRKAMNWDSPDADMLEFYRRMTALRRSEPCLAKGDFSAVLCEGGCYAFARRYGDETVYAVFNNSDKKKKLKIPLYEQKGCRLVSLLDGKIYESVKNTKRRSFHNGDVNEYNSRFRLILPAYQLDIIKRRRN